MPNGTNHDTSELWAVVTDTKVIVARIEQKLDDHMRDPTIHTRPPCDAHKSLCKKLWAIGMATVTSMAAATWACLK